jgi:hypothetical protein
VRQGETRKKKRELKESFFFSILREREREIGKKKIKAKFKVVILVQVERERELRGLARLFRK